MATRTVKTTMVYTHVLEPWNGLRPPVRVRRGRQHGTIEHGRRLTVNGVQQTFQRTVKRAKLAKRVTPHTLRHTAATLLLRNGCPIGYIKEVLGHSRLETTCRYYLGVLDKVDTKRAFDQYMLIGDDSSLTR